MPKIILGLLFFIVCLFAQAQSSGSKEETEIKQVIGQLFDGMRKGDSAMVRSVFYSGARLQTTYVDKKTGKAALREESITDFAKAVGTPHKEVWDERLFAYDIKVDDNLAIAWTPYEFYLDGKFSHKGVNVFQLFKSEKGWKVISIADTRRK
ncbi:nuclear transport factor 2 family protein [Xanthocytophaga agilis]|uniref:Nuclear transport factor 2 family protein n=1 Tax=Xanthocytophaga agilis TaxID=3048010 RepID=A0AAE3UD18_9BACT|nr:nuclear transport factor 2 family protein [Xanthocytophaga agilis]MDJ1499891.1 nuclear transport factor 2 family protein [Xanthocytophaga agilis]